MTKVGVIHENARISRRFWRKLISLRSILTDYIIALMNSTFLSFDHFYISSRPNFPHGRSIKGNSVCIQAKHAWISWFKTTCTLIGVFNICMFNACIFPRTILLSTLAFINFCSAFCTVRIMIRCAKDNLPKRFRCRTL